MQVGVQFNATVPASTTQRWYTFDWPHEWHVVWYIVPTTPQVGAPQIEWELEVERASDAHITYWLTVRNLTSTDVNIEARYAILN